MLRAALAFALAIVLPVAAEAVLIDGIDGSVGAAPFPVTALNYVGTIGGLSAIYLGNGVVLTANHVGAGDFTLGGTVYRYVPGSEVRVENDDGTDADLLMFAIQPHPSLHDLPLAQARPAYHSPLLVAGNGHDRGEALVWDPNGSDAPGPTEGYAWDSPRSLRWGRNHCEIYPQGRVFNTEAFGSFFDADLSFSEAQAVPGDSGGGAFSISPLGGWELSGVMIGIVQYSGQPPDTTFFGQRTYYADVSYYRPLLVEAVALPEPSGALIAGGAFAAGLATRRRSGSSSRSRRCACAGATPQT